MKTAPLQKQLLLKLAKPASLSPLYGLTPPPWSTVSNKQDELPSAVVLHPRAQIIQDPILACSACLGVCLFLQPLAVPVTFVPGAVQVGGIPQLIASV